MSSVEEDIRKALNKAPFADPFIETFDAATDSLEAIREAIDGIEAGVYTYCSKSGPAVVEIDDGGEFSVELLNPGNVIIPVGSITPGTYQIDRIRNNVLTTIVPAAAASKAAGRIYCTYQFTVAAGWAVGDLFKITFSGGSVTIGGTTTAFPDAFFYGRIVREEVISDRIGTPPANLVDIVTMLGNPNTAGRTLYDNLGDFIAQTNLKSLLAVLGSGWNTVNKDIYTALITDRLDHTDYGLAALHGDIGDKGVGVDIITRLGAWDGGADPQGDLFQALGVPITNSVWSAVQYIHHAAVAGPAAGSLANVLAEAIYGRTNLKTLNALLGIPDDVNGSLGDRLGFSTVSPFTATENLKDILGNLSTTKNLGGILGAFTTAENLKGILGDLSTTKRLGQILGALDETNTLKAILGAFTATENLKGILGDLTTTKNLGGILGAFTTAENLKGILGDLSTTKRLGQILGALDETNTLKAILGAFTATENLKGILGDLTTTKNLGGILGAFTTTENLKAILGDLTTTKNLGGILGAFTTAENLKEILGDLSTTKNLGGILGAFTTVNNLRALLGTGWTPTINLFDTLGGYTNTNTLKSHVDPIKNADISLITLVTRSIADYIRGIGINIAVDGFSSAAVTANPDGSIFERLEDLKTILDDKVTNGTHNVEVAHGNTEQTVVIFKAHRTGELAVQLDLNALVVAVEGGTVTVRLKHMIDNTTRRIIDRATFIVGTDEIHPTVSGWVDAANANGVEVTIRCSSAVTATRVIPYKIMEAA
jgi:hypothetical protein